MPACIADVLVDNARFPAPVCAAARALRRSKPFRGTYDERCEKFTAFVAAMNEGCDMNIGIAFADPDCENSFNSGVDNRGDRPVIVIAGKLSIATLFYLVAGCMADHDPRMASHWGRMRWAANLFKRFFPVSFRGIDTTGEYLTRNV